MDKKYLEELSPEEKYVIANKGTERLFPVSITNIMKKEHIAVEPAEMSFISRTQNLVRDVVGHLLTKK